MKSRKGKQIYFTANELQRLNEALQEWEDYTIQNDEAKFMHIMKYGLGNAWRKIAEADKKIRAKSRRGDD
ncbi:MAG: hypothetical protein ACI4HI_09880 [Lachnospiraceae bacterium]